MKLSHINGSTISLAAALLSWIFAIIFICSWSIAAFILALVCQVMAVLFGYLSIIKRHESDNEEMKALSGVILGSTSFLVLMTSLIVITCQLGNMLDSIYENWW